LLTTSGFMLFLKSSFMPSVREELQLAGLKEFNSGSYADILIFYFNSLF
jgi:hypothetical protein